MQPLGSTALVRAYHERIFASHDYRIEADILDASGRFLASAALLDGQIDIQRSATVRRTAGFTFSDPFGSLALDPDGPWEGAPFASQQVRIRHIVDVPGFGDVEAVPFVGPVVSLDRNGPEVRVEAQDRTFYALRGKRPLTVARGRNAVEAIRLVMSRAGEKRFRLPEGTRERLKRSYSVGWSDEASPWEVCRKIAASLGWQLFYTCDGYLSVRVPATTPALTLTTDASITDLPSGALDVSAWTNYARVTGRKVGKSHLWNAMALPPQHRMSPQSLARGGEPMYLPVTESGSYKTKKAALNKAAAMLAPFRPMTRDMSLNCVPFFHGDVDDRLAVVTPDGTFVLPLSEASIPLGPSEMTIGALRPVSQARAA